MTDLDLYADLFENDVEGEHVVPDSKNVTDYMNRLLYKYSALQTEFEALQARNSRLEVERNQLIAAKDQISDNFVRLGLACRQEIVKLKQRVLWLCKKVKAKEPKFSYDASRAPPQSSEMNLEKPVMYSTLLAYLHTNQSPTTKCDSQQTVTTTSCPDIMPKMVGAPCVSSSMNLQPSPFLNSTIKKTEPVVTRRDISLSCSSSCSSSSSSTRSSSSSSTSSTVSSHLSSVSNAGVDVGVTCLKPVTSPPPTTKSNAHWPQHHRPSMIDVLTVDNTTKVNLVSSRPSKSSPLNKNRFVAKQVSVGNRTDHYNRECNKSRGSSQTKPSPNDYQRPPISNQSKPIPSTKHDRQRNRTRHPLPFDASAQKSGMISHIQSNGSLPTSKVASYEEWEANRITRSRGIRHPHARNRSYAEENHSNDLPHLSSNDKFSSVDEFRDRQHTVTEICARHRSPDSRQPSKTVARSTSSAALSREKMVRSHCDQQKLYRNEDSGLGLATEDRIRRQLLSLVQHSVCQAREHHAVRRARQPALTITVQERSKATSTDSHPSVSGEQAGRRRRRHELSGSRDSVSPTVYTKRFRSRQERPSVSTPTPGLSQTVSVAKTMLQATAPADATSYVCVEDLSGVESNKAGLEPSSASPLIGHAGPASATNSSGIGNGAVDCLAGGDHFSTSFSSMNDTVSNQLESNSLSSRDCVQVDKIVDTSTSSSVALNMKEEKMEVAELKETQTDLQTSTSQSYSRGDWDGSEQINEDISDQVELHLQPGTEDQWSSWDEVHQPVGDVDQDQLLPLDAPEDSDDDHKEEGEIADDDYEDVGDDLDRPLEEFSTIDQRSWSNNMENEETAGGRTLNWLVEGQHCRHTNPADQPASRSKDRTTSSTHPDSNQQRNRSGKNKGSEKVYGRNGRPRVVGPMWRANAESAGRTLNDDDFSQPRSKPLSTPSPASPRDTHGSSLSGSPVSFPPKTTENRSRSNNRHDSSSSSWYARRRGTTSVDGDDPTTDYDRHPGVEDRQSVEKLRRYNPGTPDLSTAGQRHFRRQSLRRSLETTNKTHFPADHHRRETQKAKIISRAPRSPSDHRPQYGRVGGKPGRGIGSRSSRSWVNREDRRLVYRSTGDRCSYSPAPSSSSLPRRMSGDYRQAGLSHRRRPPPLRVSRARRRF